MVILHLKLSDSCFFQGHSSRFEQNVLPRRLRETIGLGLDKNAAVAYVGELPGRVYTVDLKTKAKMKTALFPELGDITGTALT